MTDTPTQDRIAKLLAHAGVGSRRDIEKMILDGRVRQGDTILDNPAVKLASLDGVTVDGKPVRAQEQLKLWRYHKPNGLITTHKDPQGRKTIFEALPAHIGRVISIGRLDLTTEGLLLLTNDGDLARWMELPETAIPRTYRARVYGRVDKKALQSLKRGVTIEGVRYGPIEAWLEKQEGANGWIEVTITEGKNREVRRVLSHLGLTVNRLIRTAYGPFRLASLEKGAVSPVGIGEMDELLKAFLDKHPEKRVGEKEVRNKAAWAKAKSDDNPIRKMKQRKAQEAKAAAEAKAEAERKERKKAAKKALKLAPKPEAATAEASARPDAKAKAAAPAKIPAKAQAKPDNRHDAPDRVYGDPTAGRDLAKKLDRLLGEKPAKSGGKPGGKPAGKPAGKPSGKPGARPAPRGRK